MIYEKMTTDALLERLPDNLHLARNSSAGSYDRWRIFNSFTGKYVEPGKPSARDLLIYTLDNLALQGRSWCGGGKFDGPSL